MSKKLNKSELCIPLNLCHFCCDVAINIRNWKHFDKIESLLLYKAEQKNNNEKSKNKSATTCYS